MYLKSEEFGLRKTKILLADNTNYVTNFYDTLKNKYDILICSYKKDLESMVKNQKYDLIFLNEQYLKKDSLISKIKETYLNLNFPIIFISESDKKIADNANDFIKNGGCAYFTKNFAKQENHNIHLMNLIDKALYCTDKLNGINYKKQILIFDEDTKILDIYRKMFEEISSKIGHYNLFTARTNLAAHQILSSNNIGLTVLSDKYTNLESQLRHINRYKPTIKVNINNKKQNYSKKNLITEHINFGDTTKLFEAIKLLDDKKEKINKNIFPYTGSEILICGASNAGKDTIGNFISKINDKFEFIPSWKNRKLRPFEVNNHDTIVILDEKKITQESFLTYKNWKGVFVGINKKEINESLNKGNIPYYILTDINLIDKLQREKNNLISVLIDSNPKDIIKRIKLRDGELITYSTAQKNIQKYLLKSYWFDHVFGNANFSAPLEIPNYDIKEGEFELITQKVLSLVRDINQINIESKL
jgi:guanylate kinase